MLLEVHQESIESTISAMLLQNELVSSTINNQQAIYLPAYFYAEIGIAKRLYEISHADFSIKQDINIDMLIDQIQSEQQITLAKAKGLQSTPL